MADFRFSMLFQANAAQAKAEVAAMRAEVTKLGQETAGAGRSAAGAGPAIGSVGDAARATAADLAAAGSAGADWDAIVQATRASINPLIAEYQLLGEGIRNAALYEEMGATSAREAAIAHDQLARWAIDLTGRMEAAGVSIDGTTAAMTRQETAIQQLIARQTGLASATETSIAAQLQHGQALDAIRAQYDPLFAASREYELELGRIAEAERRGAISAGIAAQARERAAQQILVGQRQIGQSAQQANAHLANLGFQANDIFMMMAAGQNPLMLAIQQGTQVSQVFGMMRAEGQALGPAIRASLLGMLNPISLVTMGVIALGAYAVQALFSTDQAADATREGLDDLAAAAEGYGRSVQRAVAPSEELQRSFGTATEKARELLLEIAKVDQWKASAAATAAGRDILGDTGLNLQLQDFGNQKDLLDALGLSTWEQSAWDTVRGIQAAFRSLDAASLIPDVSRRIEAQFTAATQLRDLWADATMADGTRTENEERILGLMGEQVLALMKMREQQEAITRAESARVIGAARASGNESARMGAPMASDFEGIDPEEMARRGRARSTARDQIAADQAALEIMRLRLAYGEQSAEVRAEEARQAQAALELEIQRSGIGVQSLEAERMRANLSAQLALEDDRRRQSQQAAFDQLMSQYAAEQQIAALTAQYGADSLEVAYARAAAEREVMAAQIEAQGFTGQAAADLLAAWDAARGIASVDMASGVGAAAAQARLLAASLGISLQQAVALMGLGGGKGPAAPEARVSWGAGSALSGLGSGTSLTFGDNPGSAPPVNLPSGSVPTGGGSGGGAAAEADAVKDLIAELERQNAALRVLNPLQQEIERNHEALAKATEAEREKVETLIAERLRLEEIRDRLDQIEQAGESAFKGLITGAYSFREALSMVLAKLIEMQASSLWDMIWGGTGGGGGLGGFLAGLLGLPAKAEGGKVEGPGGPREDNLLHWLSAGEYIVNAHATAANLPLLEAINAGVPLDRLVDMIGGQRLPALADGGLVGAAAPRAWGQRMEAAKAELARSTAAQAERPGMDVRLFMDRDGNWQAAVERISGNVAVEAMSSGLEIFSAQVLPDRMAEIQSQPRVRG